MRETADREKEAHLLAAQNCGRIIEFIKENRGDLSRGSRKTLKKLPGVRTPESVSANMALATGAGGGLLNIFMQDPNMLTMSAVLLLMGSHVSYERSKNPEEANRPTHYAKKAAKTDGLFWARRRATLEPITREQNNEFLKQLVAKLQEFKQAHANCAEHAGEIATLHEALKKYYKLGEEYSHEAIETQGELITAMGLLKKKKQDLNELYTVPVGITLEDIRKELAAFKTDHHSTKSEEHQQTHS